MIIATQLILILSQLQSKKFNFHSGGLVLNPTTSFRTRAEVCSAVNL